VLLWCTINAFGTTWAPAYPYTQHIEGQKITIKAIPYAPYTGSPMPGSTKIFYNDKLLYTIDKYYREGIYTSDNGKFLAIVNTSNSTGVSSYTSFGREQINFNQRAITIFKNGKLFKTLSLKDVIDTTKLASNGRFFDWGYYTNPEDFESAEIGCQSCMEIYGEKALQTCDTNEIDLVDCEECQRECDSTKLKEIETKLNNNSIFVENNFLIILTNQGIAIKLDFVNFKVQKIPFNTVIPQKQRFNPPKLIRQYNEVELPEKFDEPNMKNGESFDLAVAKIFSLSVSENNESQRYGVFIRHLVINRKGRCIEFYGNVYDKGISKYSNEAAINKEMTFKLRRWALKQMFDVSLIPKEFDKYSFLCIVDLK
jgi:hypothetical protein